MMLKKNLLIVCIFLYFQVDVVNTTTNECEFVISLRNTIRFAHLMFSLHTGTSHYYKSLKHVVTRVRK